MCFHFAFNFLDVGLDFAGIEFYKFLASSLHPAGARSLMKRAFLEISDMSPTTLFCLILFVGVYKPLVSKLHHAGAFSFVRIASLEISSMDIIKVSFFSKGV